MKKLLGNSAYIALAFALIMPNAQANRYPLSPESKKFVTIAAAIGATVGGLLGVALYSDSKKINQAQSHDSGLWAALKEVLTFSATVLPPALIGATIGGGITYFFTYEKTLEWAENSLVGIENDAVFKDAIASNNIADIKGWCFKERFPTIAAFNKLDSLYESLDSIKQQLIKIVSSGIAPLTSLARGCIDRIDSYQISLREWLTALKTDPHYLAEMVVQTNHQMAVAQTELARSQRRLADIKFWESFGPKHVVVHHR